MDRYGRCRRGHSRQEGRRDMSLLAAIRKLWHSVAPRTHSDVEEEFRSTLDAYQEDLMRQGLCKEEAHRKARIDLGGPVAQNETYRNAIGLRLFDELSGDLRYGLRSLRRNPGFAAARNAAVLCSVHRLLCRHTLCGHQGRLPGSSNVLRCACPTSSYPARAGGGTDPPWGRSQASAIHGES